MNEIPFSNSIFINSQFYFYYFTAINKGVFPSQSAKLNISQALFSYIIDTIY